MRLGCDISPLPLLSRTLTFLNMSPGAAVPVQPIAVMVDVLAKLFRIRFLVMMMMILCHDKQRGMHN